jgi:CRISPR-associated protein Csd1
LAVSDYLKSVWGGIPQDLNHAQFHIAVLLAGTGRFSVRSWSTEFLGEVDRKLRSYFEALRLPGNDPVNIGAMARCTIPKTKKSSKTQPTSTTYEALFESAWRGSRLPVRLLENITKRQSIEFSKGFSEKERFEFEARLRARAALSKLYFFSNHQIIMNETAHATDEHPAYLCGRVLAVLDYIHNEAHEKITSSSPASRYYGSASSTPALVFPRLCILARIHLDKIKSPKAASDLDHDLTRLVAKFAKDAAWPRTLALEDQGRFAIGFYYERSRQHQEPSSNPDAAQ